MTTNHELGPLLTAQEIAKLLQVSLRTVWSWNASGRLPPPVRFTRQCTRWLLADIEAQIQKIRGAPQ